MPQTRIRDADGCYLILSPARLFRATETAILTQGAAYCAQILPLDPAFLRKCFLSLLRQYNVR
jgi:hypothetical protein